MFRKGKSSIQQSGTSSNSVLKPTLNKLVRRRPKVMTPSMRKRIVFEDVVTKNLDLDKFLDNEIESYLKSRRPKSHGREGVSTLTAATNPSTPKINSSRQTEHTKGGYRTTSYAGTAPSRTTRYKIGPNADLQIVQTNTILSPTRTEIGSNQGNSPGIRKLIYQKTVMPPPLFSKNLYGSLGAIDEDTKNLRPANQTTDIGQTAAARRALLHQKDDILSMTSVKSPSRNNKQSSKL